MSPETPPKKKMSLLEALEQCCNVDVDDVSTDVVNSLPFTPHNQTSNQAIITSELLKGCNRELLTDLVRKYGKDGWEKVYDMAAVHLCKRNLYCLSGRVLVQVSPRHVNDREAILQQCRSFADAFEACGIRKNRFAIKLPFTGAAASAALELNREGIRTLATTVFCLEQAIAASQSNCIFISPYFNEIVAHFDESQQWKVENPESEHPMSARIIHILEAYTEEFRRTGKEQPIMVIASHVNVKEVLAMAKLGCQHITISAANLKLLMEEPCPVDESELPRKQSTSYANTSTPQSLKFLSSQDPFSGPDWDGVKATMDTDYVSNGGAKLDDFLNKSTFVKKRFQDAMDFFMKVEEMAKEAILKEMEVAHLSDGCNGDSEVNV